MLLKFDPRDFQIEQTSSTAQDDSPFSASDFGIEEANPGEELDPLASPPPPPQKGKSDPLSELAKRLNSSGSSTPPPPEFSKPPYPAPKRQVCERCGTVLRPDDTECSGCGKPYQKPQVRSVKQKLVPPPPSSGTEKAAAYPPIKPPTPPPPRKFPKGKIPDNAAKCAKCGFIVYDFETNCQNCGRVLNPPSSKKSSDTPPGQSRTPPGAARCSKCNSIVYPHHKVCPKCGRRLTPTSTQPYSTPSGPYAPRSPQPYSTPSPYAPYPSQPYAPSGRMSRCRRCGNKVYPTDTVCSNCGRRLN